VSTVVLAGVSPAQDVYYQGLLNQPLGGAALQIDPGSGELQLTNIGSSGQDGVRILHTGFQGLDLEWAPPQNVVDGTEMEVLHHGSIDGGQSQLLARARGVAAAGNIELYAEHPQSLPGGQVQYQLGGQTLRTFTIQPGQPLGILLGNLWYSDEHVEVVIDPITGEWCTFTVLTMCHRWTDTCLTLGVLDDTGIVWPEIDQIVFKSTLPGPGTIVLDETEVYLTSTGDLTLQTESVHVFDHGVVGIDNGILTLVQSLLRVSNIGSSGEDGVAIGFDMAEVAAVALDHLPDPAMIPTGTELAVSSTGVMGGQQGAGLGLLRLRKTPGPLAADVDYSGSGATSVMLELLLNGQQVYTGSLPMGVVLRFFQWPDICGKRIIWWPFPVPCYWLQWYVPLNTTVPGIGTFMVDEARILAEDAQLPVTQIDTFLLEGTGLGSFDIAAISSEPLPVIGTPYCFGDGGGAACPCGNEGGSGQGCANSHGAGAVLSATGSASVAGNMTLRATNAIHNQPGLLFQADNRISGGAGIPFGDGLRCAGGGVQRLEVVFPDVVGQAHSSVDVAAQGQVAPGETKQYQLWYRDPSNGPCSSGFNLSNALELTWTP
jgi:hypothetical protein